MWNTGWIIAISYVIIHLFSIKIISQLLNFMRMESPMGAMEVIDKEKEKKDKLEKELRHFFDLMSGNENRIDNDYDDKYKYLLERNGESIESILEATKDSREVLLKLKERAQVTLKEVDAELEWENFDFSGNRLFSDYQFTTKEGKEKALEEAKPEYLANEDLGMKIPVMPEWTKNLGIRDWGDLNNYLMSKHRFDGLSKEQIEEVVDAEGDLDDFHEIRNKVYSQLENMAYNRRNVERGKDMQEEYEKYIIENPSARTSSDKVIDKVVMPFDTMMDILENTSYKKNLIRAKIYGKLQKLRFAPRFVGDKIDDFVDALKEDIKNIFKNEENGK